MEDNKVYQFFSLRTGQFLKATRKHVRADGTDERCIETKIKAVDGTFTPDYVSYFLVFSRGKQNYVLYVNDNDKFKLKEFTDEVKENKDRSALFIPESFGSSPFRAFKLVKQGLENYCIAANRKGRLSLKVLNMETPHPGTMFVVSNVD